MQTLGRQSEMSNPNDGYGQNLACLTFEYTATNDNDTVYFAHCYPYTYTDVTNLVNHTCTF